MTPPANLPTNGDDESSMNFIETARYQRFSTTTTARELPIPQPWEQFKHPNGDIYHYNQELRLITPDDIRNPTVLRFIIEAWEYHIQSLDESSITPQLAHDWELTLSDVTDTAAVIGMYSRQLGVAYDWAEGPDLKIKSSEHFWSYVAEYPSHHRELPPNAEAAFVRALNNAKIAVTDGSIFPFSEAQIDQIRARYENLKALQTQGRQVIPALGWLIGAVMPLDAVGKTYSDGELDDLMERMRF